jgi:hypothetical protein
MSKKQEGEKKNGHGGKREGAGRPATVELGELPKLIEDARSR